MFKRPSLNPGVFSYVPEDGQGAILLAEKHTFFHDQALFGALVPLLDGTHTMQQIATLIGKEYPLQDILGAIHLLDKLGYLIDGAAQTAATNPYWAAQGISSGPRQAAVTVRGFGAVPLEPFTAALARLDIAAAADAPIELLLTDDYLRPELASYNREAQRPWLLVKPVGLEIRIGPLFVPGETACWECLSQRLRLNSPEQQLVEQETGRSTRFIPVALPTTVQLAADLAATHLAHWFVVKNYDLLKNKLFSWDYAALRMDAHPVVRRPQCPVCGNATPAEPGPVVLRALQQIQSVDGGYRSVSAQDTLDRYNHHVSPLTGLVTNLDLITREEGIFVYRAKSPSVNASESWPGLKYAARNHAGGKGRTDQQAKVSALCEALERYSAQWFGDEHHIVASYEQLGDQAIHPGAVQHFSAAQYRDRAEHNRRAVVNIVPIPFDESMPVSWVKVWSLRHGTAKYLPAAMCHIVRRGGDRPTYFRGDSNGNAAGSTVEDAILQGFLELVERDAVAIWWYNRLRRPAVSLAGFDDAFVANMLRYYEQLNRAIWLLDLTTDLGIPTIVAISQRNDGQHDGTCYGFGAHFDPRIAAVRALTELNQMLPLVLRHVEREDRRLPAAGTDSYTLRGATLEDEPCLAPAAGPAKHMADYATPPADIVAAVQTAMERVEQLGMDMLVYDLTRADVGLAVFKVIVPGMRHFWRRLAPGRLYDVPVKLGWLAAPLREDQLNQRDITL